MFLWRPIIRGKCSLVELKTVLTLDDAADLNEAMDLEDAIAIQAEKR
jgi:hypothetical protein